MFKIVIVEIFSIIKVYYKKKQSQLVICIFSVLLFFSVCVFTLKKSNSVKYNLQGLIFIPICIYRYILKLVYIRAIRVELILQCLKGTYFTIKLSSLIKIFLAFAYNNCLINKFSLISKTGISSFLAIGI